MSLESKVALVTGASRGIGHAIALALGKVGAVVIGTATTEEGVDRITQSFKLANVQGEGALLDVTRTDSLEHLLLFLKQKYTMPSVLINNAAVTKDNLLLRMKEEEWDTVIETNLNSIYRLTKACLRDMVKAQWGRIISISSVVGAIGNPGQANYAAAKAGLIGFTKALALEIASRNITANVVAPGFIDTDMTRHLPENQREWLLQRIPAQRLGQPDDVAAAVLFFASVAAGYITGQTLHVNGGMYMI